MTVARTDLRGGALVPGTGRLLLDASRSGLSPHLRGRRVAVTVDGLPLRCGWGRTSIDLPAGRHAVEIEVEHTGGWGRVADAVPVAAGHTVEAYYRAPALPRVAGSLRPTAQRTRGAAADAALVGALAAMLAASLMLLAGAVLGVVGLLG